MKISSLPKPEAVSWHFFFVPTTSPQSEDIQFTTWERTREFRLFFLYNDSKRFIESKKMVIHFLSTNGLNDTKPKPSSSWADSLNLCSPHQTGTLRMAAYVETGERQTQTIGKKRYSTLLSKITWLYHCMLLLDSPFRVSTYSWAYSGYLLGVFCSTWQTSEAHIGCISASHSLEQRGSGSNHNKTGYKYTKVHLSI